MCWLEGFTGCVQCGLVFFLFERWEKKQNKFLQFCTNRSKSYLFINPYIPILNLSIELHRFPIALLLTVRRYILVADLNIPALSVYTKVRKFLHCPSTTAPAIKYTCCWAYVAFHHPTPASLNGSILHASFLSKFITLCHQSL